MTRTSKTAKAVVLAGAVAASALTLTPAQADGIPTITKIAPLKAATTVAANIAITGTNFSDDIETVTFTSGETTCASSSVVVVSATQLYAKKPAAGCADGAQTVKMLSAEGESEPAKQLGVNFSDAAKTVTFATPVTVSDVSPKVGLASGGTEIVITVSSNVSTPAASATINGAKLTGFAPVAGSTTQFKGKVPAGVPGTGKLVVTTNGVNSAANSDFTYKQSIKVTPSVFVKGATAPAIKIDGIGLKPATASKVSVTVCGVPATVASVAGGTGATAVKAPTNTTIYATAPAFAAVAEGASDGDVDVDNGGVCIVRVTVDPKGDTAVDAADGDPSKADDYSSVVTGTSAFVYAGL